MKDYKNKIIGLDKFIENSLYDKRDGYYMSKDPFGKKGDFITSSNISIFFSEMLAIWILSFWEKLNKPKKINIIDMGGGNGEMSFNILNTLNKFSQFKKNYCFYIHEKSPYLKRKQKFKIKNSSIIWINNLEKIKDGPCLFLANEFFDSFPIKQFLKKDKAWFERKVKFSRNKSLVYVDQKTNIKSLDKKIGVKLSNNQTFIEISENTIKYFKSIYKIIAKKNGGLLIIDYGYFDKKMKNTLRGFSNHKIVNILEHYKKCDITHSLPFDSLKKIAKKVGFNISGITTQGSFLKKLGIVERAEMVSKKMNFSDKANIYYRLEKLIGKQFMGDVFKVMLLTNNKTKFKIGF